MNEQNENKGYSRRRFISAALGAILSGPAAVIGGREGQRIAQSIPIETYSHAELDKYKKLLNELYGLEVTDDIWTKGHTPMYPLDPSRTLVVGEFDNIAIDGTYRDAKFLNDGKNIPGRQVATSELAEKFIVLADSVPVILATDNKGRALDHYIANYEISFENMNAYTYLDLINNFVPIVLGVVLGVARSGSTMNDVYDKDITDGQISRRKFLGLAGIAATSALVSGAVDKLISNEVINIRKSAEPMISIAGQPEYMQDLIVLHNPFNELITHIRDRNMMLRTVAFSAVLLNDHLDNLQLSMANGHSNVFTLSQDIDEVKQVTTDKIIDLVTNHLRIFKKYEHTNLEVRDAVQNSLILDFGFYEPLNMRVNPKPDGTFTLDWVRSQIGSETICPESFLLFCRAIKQIEDSLDPESSEYALLRDSFDMATWGNMQLHDKVEENGIHTGPAGNRDMIDEVVTVFGTNFRFSRGLFVTITF